jgi:hypothetical protein
MLYARHVDWRIPFGFYYCLNMITATYIEHRHRKHLLNTEVLYFSLGAYRYIGHLVA